MELADHDTVGILSFFFIILGAVCLCSRRTRQRLLTPVTRRFTNNTLVASRGMDSTAGRGGGDMHKSLMSEAESMAFTATSPRDVKAPPPMAMVDPPRGLSQNPVFMGAAYPSRPNSWRTWRPSATFAQGLDPVPDDMQLPPPPPHALTARYSAFPPRGSGVSTGEDSSMPEYGAWPPTASNADFTALRPAPGQAVALTPDYAAAVGSGDARVQSREYFRQQEIDAADGHASYVTYSETPLATPRTPMVVEGEQLAPLASSQEASPVDNCDYDSGEGGDAGATTGARSDDNIWWSEEQSGVDDDNNSNTARDGRVGSGDGGDDEPENGIQEAQLGRQAEPGGGHGGGAQGVEAEPPGEQVQRQAEQGQRQGEPGERGEQVFEEVEAVQRQQPRLINIGPRSSSRAPSSLEDGDESRSSLSSDAGFSWSEAASERFTAPRDGFGLSIIDVRHRSRSTRRTEEGPVGPPTRPSEDG